MMRCAVHVIPCRGLLADASHGPGRLNGSGIATAALRTAERLEQPADLVLIAVPAGEGNAVADRLFAARRPPVPRRPPSRYISERGHEVDELGDVVA